MTEVPDSSVSDASGTDIQELSKKLKSSLQGFKLVLVKASPILIWEKQQDPAIVSGLITLVFLIVWYCDATILTTCSVLGIIGCLLDYLVPIVCNNVFDTSKWSENDDKKYNDICSELALTLVTVKSTWNSWQNLKDSNPKMYFISLLTALIILAWIGNLINNLLLTYLIFLFVGLLPGLKHHGIVQKFLSELPGNVKKLIGVKDKAN